LIARASHAQALTSQVLGDGSHLLTAHLQALRSPDASPGWLETFVPATLETDTYPTATANPSTPKEPFNIKPPLAESFGHHVAETLFVDRRMLCKPSKQRYRAWVEPTAAQTYTVVQVRPSSYPCEANRSMQAKVSLYLVINASGKDFRKQKPSEREPTASSDLTWLYKFGCTRRGRFASRFRVCGFENHFD